VDLYNEEQKKVLSIRPGITDNASIIYRNENDILSKSDNPELMYTEIILPEKLKLNLEYINNRSLTKDIKIILKTLKSIFV